MDQGPLVGEQIESGAELVNRLRDHFAVEAAFWLKADEDGQWFLYVASSQINDSNVDVAYGSVLQVAAEMPEPKIDPFQVKIVGADHPVARAVLELQRRYPGRMRTRYQGLRLGGLSTADVHIYPPAAVPVP
jgi:hypothetical protein